EGGARDPKGPATADRDRELRAAVLIGSFGNCGRPRATLVSLRKLGRSAMKRWKHRPEGSTWGDWGDDDQLGRLNLITPKKVLEGIAEVKEGRSFCLSLPLDLPGGNVLNVRRLPPVLSPTGDENGWRFNFLTNTINPLFQDVACDDRVLLTLQYST